MGLTLIELVIVMVILSTLAALVIPKLSFIQQQSIPVSGAAGSQDLMNNLETYKVSTGFYPQGFDSLLANGATGLMTQLVQGPGGTPPVMPFAAGTLNGSDPYVLASFGMAFGPSSGSTGTTAYRIFDQDGATALATEDVSSSFNTYRELYSTGNVATVSPTTGANIWQAAFPGSVVGGTFTQPAGVTLIALGVGPQCNAVGSTMASAPLQSGQAPGIYARYFAIFAVYGTGSQYPGKAAELKLVLDSYYNTINTNIGLYRQAAPTDQ
jgi:competence protein ComGC